MLVLVEGKIPTPKPPVRGKPILRHRYMFAPRGSANQALDGLREVIPRFAGVGPTMFFLHCCWSRLYNVSFVVNGLWEVRENLQWLTCAEVCSVCSHHVPVTQ